MVWGEVGRREGGRKRWDGMGRGREERGVGEAGRRRGWR